MFRGSAKAKSILDKLVEYPNVPRKKAKFVNFVHNSFRYLGANDSQINEIWTVIESIDKKKPDERDEQRPVEKSEETVGNGQSNGEAVGKKRKLSESEPPVAQQTESLPFDWLSEIKRVCCKKSTGQIALDKLEKKVGNQSSTSS